MAASAPEMVFQFKVTLKDIKPPIWRRILVPADYSFYDLHVAIQSTMEWIDSHMHQFRVRNPRTLQTEFISDRDEKEEDWFSLLPVSRYVCGRTRRIADYFLVPRDRALYEYDFGDSWEHEVVLEKIVPAKEGEQYPKCVAGRNAGPPEDCGSVGGYMRLKEIIADPSHPEHQERMEWLRWVDWLGGDFNPAKFYPKAVVFRDPEEEWKFMQEFEAKEAALREGFDSS